MEAGLVSLILAVFSFRASCAAERTLCTTADDDLQCFLKVFHLLSLRFKVRYELRPRRCDNPVYLLIVFLIEVNKVHKARDVA